MLVASTAGAELVVELEPLRSWPVPLQMSPHTAHIDAGVDGAVVMMSRTGMMGDEPAADEMECLVAVSDAERALSYEVRHDHWPTRCVDAVLHPDGGFILRGEVLDSSQGTVSGFTSGIDADGQVLWSVSDEMFVKGEEEPFDGDWIEALEGLAYDEVGDDVMALTMGERQLGSQQRALIQAHSIDAGSGELIGSGKTFGATKNDVVQELVARDGEFLVVTVDDLGEETRFYSHEVGLGAFRFEPDDRDWTEYELAGPVAYRSDAGTFYLWRRSDEEKFGVMRVEGLDDVVWDASFGATVHIEGQEQFVGEPDRLWVSRDLVVVRHDITGQHPYLRFLDREDGTEKVVVSRGGLTTYEELDIAYGEDGGLVLLALNPVEGRIWEYGLDVVEARGSTKEDDGPDGTEGGCTSSPGTPQAVFAVVVFVVWGLRRDERRSSIVVVGDARVRSRTLAGMWAR